MDMTNPKLCVIGVFLSSVMALWCTFHKKALWRYGCSQKSVMALWRTPRAERHITERHITVPGAGTQDHFCGTIFAGTILVRNILVVPFLNGVRVCVCVCVCVLCLCDCMVQSLSTTVGPGLYGPWSPFSTLSGQLGLYLYSRNSWRKIHRQY